MKKRNTIVELLEQHLNTVKESFRYYLEKMEHIEHATKAQKKEYMGEIDMLEDRADSVRHQIIQELLTGKLLLDSSKSIAVMIEHIDDIANQCEDILEEIYLQDLKLLPVSVKAIHCIHGITAKQMKNLEEIVLGVVSRYKTEEMQELIKKIEKQESEVDQVEHVAIKEIFELDIKLAEKLQQKEIIRKVGHIADIIENLSDEVEIIMMSRRV